MTAIQEVAHAAFLPNVTLCKWDKAWPRSWEGKTKTKKKNEMIKTHKRIFSNQLKIATKTK